MSRAAKGPIKWDKGKIVAALRERQAKGLGLNAWAIKRSDPQLASAIERHFSSHDAALRAAGGDPDGVRLSGPAWDKGRIISALRERRDKGLGVNAGALSGVWAMRSAYSFVEALCTRERRVLKYALQYAVQ